MLQKKAEALASELKAHQGELADYNIVVDKMNVNEGVEDIEAECAELKVSIRGPNHDDFQGCKKSSRKGSNQSGTRVAAHLAMRSGLRASLTFAQLRFQAQNDQEARAVETLFEQRQENEAKIRETEREILDARSESSSHSLPSILFQFLPSFEILI